MQMIVIDLYNDVDFSEIAISQTVVRFRLSYGSYGVDMEQSL